MTLFGVDLLRFFTWLNEDLLALPGAILFLGCALILSIKTGFIQVRAFPLFLRMLFNQKASEQETGDPDTASQTVAPLRALFAALATSIGMGNVVGPTIAVVKGGPGALFWLLFYMFFASVTKFTEVTFALYTREKMEDGHIIGGPMQYLKEVSPWLAYWYGCVMSVLFIGWSSAQSNTLASIFEIESVSPVIVGLVLAGLVFVTLQGGAKRVSALASRLVPLMFFLYISFSLFILLSNPVALYNAIMLIFRSVFTPAAAMGGFFGATVFTAMRYGIFRGVYISESGLGTSSIPHAMSDAKVPVKQGILAMGSTVADMSLSIVSGLLVLVTGIWIEGTFRTTLVYEVFKAHAPVVGQVVLVVSIALFIITTVIGNSFNGVQSFASLTQHRGVTPYLFLTVIFIFAGALMPVPLVWEILDTLLVFAAVPNIIGLVYLAFKYPEVLYLRNASE